jgi:hypothetical protein
MQIPLSPARLSSQPVLDRLGEPPTQLVPEMHDETTLSQITSSPASHSTPFGSTISHFQLSHVHHAVPPPERKPLDAVEESQMQVDTNTSEPTHQDAMVLDGGSPLPWRNPFDESDEAHSTTVNKFRLADVFVQTAKITEEWSKVERPQIPLPQRRRRLQVNSPATRAEAKAPLHKLNPRVVGTLFDNCHSDRRSSPSRKVDGAPVTAVPVPEAPPQPPALAERSGRCSLDVVQRIQSLQELVRRGEQEKGQATGNPTPSAAAPSCDSSLLKPGDTWTVSSLPRNSLGGLSTHQHGQLTLFPSLAPAKPPTMGASRQSTEKSARGQLAAPEQTCQPALATATAQSTSPAVCPTHFSPPNLGPPISPCNGPEAPGAMEIPTPKESRPSLTAAAPLPPPLVPPQQIKTEPTAIKPEPSSPKMHPFAQLITITEVPEALTETTRRSPGFTSPATPLDRRVSPPLQDVPPKSPPTIDLPSFNVEAKSPPATAPPPNTMTESRFTTPALVTRSPSLGSTIPQPAIPPQFESTTMDVPMTPPEQGLFVPRTPPRQPNHTGPLYHSPAALPPVSHSRRSASPPPRGQSFIRTRTPSRRVAPQHLSPGWRTPLVLILRRTLTFLDTI